MLIIQILNVKEKSNQDGHKKGTENSIKNSQNHSFLICVFQSTGRVVSSLVAAAGAIQV